MLRAIDPGRVTAMVTRGARRRWLGVAAWLALVPASAASADDFADLVAAERAFAADASARNVRAAFLKALADDSVVFEPGPVDGQRHWTARPDDVGKLEWAPAAAEIAASGDLGYTYGPWRFTPPDEDEPAAFGHFFTVWQKQPDGTWRALVDKGVTHPEQPLPTQVVRRGQLGVSGANGNAVSPQLLAELRQSDLLPAGRIVPSVVSPDFVRFRPGELPRTTNEAPALDAGPATRFASWAVISNAGDLAATWGGSAGGGTWLRVWRRAGVGDPPGAPWRLAADMADVVSTRPADD
jgi:ketosteroid isomerase-like protein